MPVVPWKTRKKDSELIARLYEQNQRLKQKLENARRETLREVRDFLDDEGNRSIEELRQMIGRRMHDTAHETPE